LPGSLEGHGWAGWKFPHGMELPLPGYSLPAGFMMLFVFSWPATTLSSGPNGAGLKIKVSLLVTHRSLMGTPIL